MTGRNENAPRLANDLSGQSVTSARSTNNPQNSNGGIPHAAAPSLLRNGFASPAQQVPALDSGGTGVNIPTASQSKAASSKQDVDPPNATKKTHMPETECGHGNVLHKDGIAGPNKDRKILDDAKAKADVEGKMFKASKTDADAKIKGNTEVKQLKKKVKGKAKKTKKNVRTANGSVESKVEAISNGALTELTAKQFVTIEFPYPNIAAIDLSRLSEVVILFDEKGETVSYDYVNFDSPMKPSSEFGNTRVFDNVWVFSKNWAGELESLKFFSCVLQIKKCHG